MTRLPAIALLSLLVWLAQPSPGYAMDRLHYQAYPELEGKTVTQVRIFGNNRTQERVFRREMRTTEDSPFRSDDLWRDWERLVDLGIFAEIEVDAVPSGDGVLVVLSVHERPSWFITPVLDYDFDESKLTFGYRLRVRNAGGMNRQFRSKASVGGRDRFTASWATPWLGSTRQALGVDLNLDLPRPKDDELRSNRVTVLTSRFLGDYLKLGRAVTGFVRLEQLSRDGTARDGAVDEILPDIGIGFFRDTRNVRIDPTRGSFLSTGVDYVRSWTTSNVSYVRGAADMRFFHTVGGNYVLAARGRTILSNGEIPSYRRIEIGGSRSIRGQPSDVDEGTNIALASLEFRFPLMSQRRLSIPIPLVPTKISNFDLRVDGVLFVDSGTAWDDSIGFRDARVRTGAGFGLRIFLPIVELVRLEIAFDEHGSPTFNLREGNLI